MMSSLRATHIWSSMKSTQLGCMGPEVVGWSHNSGWRIALILDGPIANANHSTFDALCPCSFRSPHTRTQRTSDQLAYGPKGHVPSTNMLTCGQHEGRDRYPG